jgi:hypothetical protein
MKGKGNVKDGSFSFGAFKPNAAVVGFDDFVGDEESESGGALLGE